MKNLDILGLFYLLFSKEGIGFILIFLSILESLSVKIYGISFFETLYTVVKNNEFLLFTIGGLYVGFLCVFVIIYYLLSRKYGYRFVISENRERYNFLILPVIVSGLFVVFFSFVFVIILINLLENFIFQKMMGIYGKSLITLIIGIVWLVIVGFFWKLIYQKE